MYLYVTSNVNNGHKIGVTDNLLKRKIQGLEEILKLEMKKKSLQEMLFHFIHQKQ